jgi:hypothetical protein
VEASCRCSPIFQISSAAQVTGQLGTRRADQGSILQRQQNGSNWYASTVAVDLGPSTCTSSRPRSEERTAQSSQSNTLDEVRSARTIPLQ